MTAEIGPDATNPDPGGVVTTPESGTGVDSDSRAESDMYLPLSESRSRSSLSTVGTTTSSKFQVDVHRVSIQVDATVHINLL